MRVGAVSIRVGAVSIIVRADIITVGAVSIWSTSSQLFEIANAIAAHSYQIAHW